MAKGTHRRLVRVIATLGWLMLMAGCDLTTNPASPVDLSTPSTDLAIFIQQFGRELLAAFLF